MLKSQTTLTTSVALAAILFTSALSADPVHRYFKRDGYWHHGSGFWFPQKIEGFNLALGPAEIDGNADVTATYEGDVNGQHQAAIVDLYFPTTVATYSKLDTARAAVQASVEKGECKASAAATKFAIDKHPEIQGTRVIYSPTTEKCAQAALYFFETPHWVISVRASTALDAFVRGLRWETLDTDPSAKDPAP